MRRHAHALTLALLALCAPFASAQHGGPPPPAPDPKDEPWLSNLRAVTTDDQRAGEAYFSADGKRLIYQAIRPEHPYYQIYVCDVDGKNKKMISTGKGKTTCAWLHPTDPDLFIYASTHLDEKSHAPPAPGAPPSRYRWDYDASFDIFQGRISTGEMTRLTDAVGYDAECAMSPDGKTICFTSNRGGDADIWLMDADGKNQRALVRRDGSDGGPFFTADGKSVIYRSSPPGSEDVMRARIVSLDGKDDRVLTPHARFQWCPFPHPDGKHAVYALNVDGGRNFDVVLLLTDGSGREGRVTTFGAFDGLPSISPDGKRMAWSTSRGGAGPQVWIADLTLPSDDALTVPPEPRPPEPKPPEYGNNPHGQPADPHASGDPHGGSNPHGGDPDPFASRAEATITPKAGATTPDVPGLAAITADGVKKDVAWLADDLRRGRRAGSEDERAAAAWLSERLKALGVAPAGKDGGWLHPFTISLGGRLAPTGNALTVDGKAWTPGEAWQPLLYSATGTVEGDLVFCGYGIVAPDEKWDDLSGLELKDKVAVVMTGGPKRGKGGAFGKDSPTVWEDLRLKVATVRDRGAKAVLLVRAPSATATGPESWLRLDLGDPGVLVGQLAASQAKALGLDLAAIVKALDEGDALNGPLGKKAHLEVAVERLHGASQNVVGRIEGSSKPDEVIVVGAHYDHLGMGGDGSLAPGVDAIHNGADDNASGTAGLLAVAAALQASKPARTVLLVAFGSEEAGLLGSKAFVEDPTTKRERFVAMVNMDMIGRKGDKPLLVGGAGTATEWAPILQATSDALALPLATQQDGMGPSDHASFYGAGIPVFFLWTGTHADYHKPTDDADKLDLEGAALSAKAAFLLVRGIDALPARPTPVKVSQPTETKRVVTGEKGAYFGSIPNYASEGVQGVLLDGARPNTPAAKAGIQAGDVVVEFAGRQVRTIHDYTNALRLSAPGDVIKVVVMRAGARVELTATLEGK